MGNPEQGGFVPEQEKDLAKIAKERWDVDINDDDAVYDKIINMQGKMPDVADLPNLWQGMKVQNKGNERQPGARQ